MMSNQPLGVCLRFFGFVVNQEISRLAGQLRRLYGSNRKASRPFHLFLTDLKEGSRLYKECLRMNDGFLNYMVSVGLRHQSNICPRTVNPSQTKALSGCIIHLTWHSQSDGVEGRLCL